MTIFFTADLHLGHKAILDYTDRHKYFASVDEMDSGIISKWNSKVTADDEIYVIGDFTLRSTSYALHYLYRLNGHKHIIPGSHDAWMENLPTEKWFDNDIIIEPPIVTLELEEYKESGFAKPLVLCHYSLRTWDRSHYRSWHLFGHSHGKLEPYGLSFDVGIDCWSYYPLSLANVANIMDQRMPIEDFTKDRS